LNLGRALYRGWAALVITGIIGGLGFGFRQPWLFPSLGPTIFIHIVTPQDKAARRWNTFVGHAIGAASAFLALFIFGALHAPSAMVGGELPASRIAASALAVGLTIGLQIPTRSGHAPAAATTLLITLGGMRADLGTVGILVVGITASTFLCDWGRRLMAYEAPLLAKLGLAPMQADDQHMSASEKPPGSATEPW